MEKGRVSSKIEQVIPKAEQGEEEKYRAAKIFAEALLRHMKGYDLEELDDGVEEIERVDQDWLGGKTWSFAERKKILIDKIRRINLAAVFRREDAFDFVVHRRYFGGKYVNSPDFDGAISLWFLQKAGADTSRVKYAYPGETPPKDSFSIDFGNKFGVILPEDEEDRTVVVDHHILDLEVAKKKGLTLKQILETCSAKFIFDGLEGCGLLDQRDQEGERLDIEALRKMAELAVMTDNKRYPHNQETFENSWQTVLGLYQQIKPDDLYEFFKRGGKITDKINPSDLTDPQKWGLTYKQKDRIINLPEKRKQMIRDSIERVRKLERDGYVVEISNQTDEKLKFLVDYIHEEMPEERKRKGVVLRTDAALALGFDGVVLYNQETKSIFVNIDPLSDDTIHLDFDGLVNVRGKMIITDALKRNHMNLSLKDLIERLGGDLSKIKGRLKNAMETNLDWIKKQKRLVEKEVHRSLLIFFGDKGWSAILPGNQVVSLPEKPDGYDARFLHSLTVENLPNGSLKVVKTEQTKERAPEPKTLE